MCHAYQRTLRWEEERGILLGEMRSYCEYFTSRLAAIQQRRIALAADAAAAVARAERAQANSPLNAACTPRLILGPQAASLLHVREGSSGYGLSSISADMVPGVLALLDKAVAHHKDMLARASGFPASA